MRLVVAVVSAGAALALIAASGLMNYVFMTSLGKTAFEQQILGVVSVAISVLLALLPTLMVWAWREGRALFVLLGLIAFAGFGALSLSSAVGFAAKNRGSLSEDRALATEKLEDLKHEIAAAETKLNALPPSRSAKVLEQALHGLEQDYRWQSSKGCREATVEASRSFCRGYFELKAEAARADEISGLERHIADLKTEAQTLGEQGAGREADNQAAVLAHLLGLKAPELERHLTVFLAVLVELGAALGLYFATGHLRTGRHDREWGRGSMTNDFEIDDGIARRVRRAGAKQIAKSVPRRVPRLGRSPGDASEHDEKKKERG